MKISKNGLNLIKRWEGRYLHSYQDSIGVWTVGYGMIDSDYKYTGIHVHKGVTITDKQCDELFEKLINGKYCPKVDKYMNHYHFNQNQYDALVSFAYNIGSIDQLTANGKRSKAEISEAIMRYNRAGGRVLRGLTNRRKAEKKLFDTPVKKVTYPGAWPVIPKRGRQYWQVGDTGEQVRRIQKIINWYNRKQVLRPDGVYGPKTFEAVMDIQGDAKTKQNGKYGKICQSYLKKVKR